MSPTDLRTELHHLIDSVDDQFVQAVHGIVKAYIRRDEIVGYEIDGTPITADAFLEQANHAVSQIKSGKKGSSIEELDKKSKEWLMSTK